MSSVGAVADPSSTLPPSVCKMTFSERLLGPACEVELMDDATAGESRDVSAGVVAVDETDGFTV